MRLLVRLKKLISRWVLLMPTYCRECGRGAEVYNASDDLWELVAGKGAEPLCVRCFNRKAEKRGILLAWKVCEWDEVKWDWDSEWEA